MAQNFYKNNGSYYLQGSNQKILNTQQLQQYAMAGGKEVPYVAPTTPTTSPPTNGAVAINGAQYNTTALQQGAFSNIYQQGNTLYGTPKVPTSLPSATVTDGTSITPATTTPTPTDSYVAGLDTGNAGFKSIIDTIMAPDPSQSKIDPLQQKINDLTGQEYNKPVDYQAQLDKYGFTTNVNDLQNLNTQIASVKAQYDSLQNQNADLPIASRIIGGTADRLTRQSAVELGGLSSMAQALQGNISMAQKIAEDTITMKYAPIEADIKNQQDQITNIYNDLTREDQQKADALTATLNERTRLINEQKQNESDINDIMTSAAKGGADLTTLQNIMSAQTPQEATLIANGATLLSGPSQLAGLTENDIIRVGTKIYKKPGVVAGNSTGKVFNGKVDSKGNPITTTVPPVSDFDYAKQIIAANPTATKEELKVGLMDLVNQKKIKLTVSEINALLATVPETKTGNNPTDEAAIQQYKDAGNDAATIIAQGFDKATVDKVFASAPKENSWWAKLFSGVFGNYGK